MMTASLRTLIVSGAIVTVTVNFAFAQADADRAIEQYSCKTSCGWCGSRDVAIAFLHGYFGGQERHLQFNLATLEKQTDAFIEYCLIIRPRRPRSGMVQSKK